MTIRPAAQKDLSAIYSLICELESEVLSTEDFEKAFLSCLLAETIYCFVAENQNHVIGFLSLHIQTLLHHCGKVAEIQEFIVDENFRGQQAGTLLFQQAEQTARQQQCKIIEVTCNRRRTDAHRFYERQQMQPTHYKFVKVLSQEATLSGTSL